MEEQLVLAAKAILEADDAPLTREEAGLIASTTQWPVVWGDAVAALVLRRSIASHSRALLATSDASLRYAKALSRATWALVLVTAILAVVAGVQLWTQWHESPSPAAAPAGAAAREILRGAPPRPAR